MTQQYTMEDVKAQIKPLSDNAFVAFFSKDLESLAGILVWVCR